MDTIELILEDVVVKEMTIDMCTGRFYTECDDETLELALTQLWEDGAWEWQQKGVILGEA
jgi:hypothetical protein